MTIDPKTLESLRYYETLDPDGSRAKGRAMTTKHTPGPWMWLSPDHITTTAGPNWASHVVADIRSHNGADARLIAAAPELLAALKIAAEAFDHTAPDYAMISAALAKAEGR